MDSLSSSIFVDATEALPLRPFSLMGLDGTVIGDAQNFRGLLGTATTIPFARTVCGEHSLRRLFCGSPVLVPSSLFRHLPTASSRNLAAAMRPAIAWWLATHPAELGFPPAPNGSILTTQSAAKCHQKGAASLRSPCRPFVTAPALRETRAVTRCGVSQRSSERISTSLRRVIERVLGGARP